MPDSTISMRPRQQDAEEIYEVLVSVFKNIAFIYVYSYMTLFVQTNPGSSLKVYSKRTLIIPTCFQRTQRVRCDLLFWENASFLFENRDCDGSNINRDTEVTFAFLIYICC